jgi:hypothetical protein
MKAKILKIDLRAGEAGLWHATSPDMPAFRVTETSREDALAQIPIVLSAYCNIDGEPVAAFQVAPENADDLRWVIVRVDYLRNALSEDDMDERMSAATLTE